MLPFTVIVIISEWATLALILRSQASTFSEGKENPCPFYTGWEMEDDIVRENRNRQTGTKSQH